MRILFDSKQLQFKEPFGTLIPNQKCRLNIYIPSSVQANAVQCIFENEDSTPTDSFQMSYKMKKGVYDIWTVQFSLDHTGLFFYYFSITSRTGSFRLFKQGEDTNMESGDYWQLSCIPADFTTPDWAKGAVIYQIFPDRFYKSGKCDLTGKLEPYTIHKDWNEDIEWQPTPEGKVLNNDFFGGNFKGIADKMDYIASMGVNIIYLNPISKSFSSHRYDTGDYKVPDPMLGTEADFVALCRAAHNHGIKIILDGVYSHTGSNSLYFDKEKTFGGKGAYCSQKSPFFSWYQFRNYPESYKSWWDFDTLPTVNKMDPSFISYIITDEDSVVAHWLKLGADGFRLDVVDELPNEFVAMLKKRIREIKPDALLIGEVWEDASNKIAYQTRKRYFVDGVLDSVMNYPFRTAIINFVRGYDDGRNLKNAVLTIAENYPPQVFSCNMNMLGTHDTARILTALVDDFEGDRQACSTRHLSRSLYLTAQERLMMAAFLQYTLPGSPCLYYGDEAGMEGFKDPFNRRTYPWGHENAEILAHYRNLGKLRKNTALRSGDISFFQASEHQIGFSRSFEGKTVRCYLNCSGENWDIPSGKILYGHLIHTLAPDWLSLSPMGFCIVEEIAHD